MTKTVVALVVAVCVSRLAGAQVVLDITPTQIDEAIRIGETKKANDAPGAYRLKLPGLGGDVIAFYTTPFSRVVGAARDAKEKYRKFSASDVTPEMIEPAVAIIAPSAAPAGEMRNIVNVTAIVILPRGTKGLDKAIQPIRTESVPETYKNLLGAVFQGSGIAAYFPLRMLNEENEVRVVFDRRRSYSPLCKNGGTDCGIRFDLHNVR